MHISLARGRTGARQWRRWWQRNRFCKATIVLLLFFCAACRVCVCMCICRIHLCSSLWLSLTRWRDVWTPLSARRQCAQRLTNFNHIQNSQTQPNIHTSIQTYWANRCFLQVFVCACVCVCARFGGSECTCEWNSNSNSHASCNNDFLPHWHISICGRPFFSCLFLLLLPPLTALLLPLAACRLPHLTTQSHDLPHLACGNICGDFQQLPGRFGDPCFPRSSLRN